ncbi:MAG: hypothetical protein WDA16_09365 [Candidatus Thermoplasmatota archaeon]
MRRSLKLALAVTLFGALHLLPAGIAHDAAEANELEVEVLRDEDNEINSARGGYDITQVFIGEAHDHTIAHGSAGDAVYWRAELYGAPGNSPLASGEWNAVFTFESPRGPIVRSIRTTDGKTFQTDFDALITNPGDGVLHVERAMIALAPNGLWPGLEIRDFRVETFVGDQLRDRAPGGTPVEGPVEIPSESRSLVDAYRLTGPIRYATASIEAAPEGARLHVTSLLKKGSQHVHIHLPQDVTTSDPTSVSVGPRGEAVFLLALPSHPTESTAFDVTTDIGGRITLLLDQAGLRPENATPAGSGPTREEARSVPLPPAVLLAAACIASLQRRRATP